jgi:hypothetical protein
MELDKAIEMIYEIMFTPNKKVELFSSHTAQALAETIESIQARAEQEDVIDEKNASYRLEFEAIPMGEIFRKYILHVFNEENLKLEYSSMLDRVFKVYLFPIYLESLVQAGYKVLSADGPEMFAEQVAVAMEIGNNQLVNTFALRYGAETLNAQNELLLEKVELFINEDFKVLKEIENVNFELKGQFLGWMDNFPIRLMNYILSFDGEYINRIGVAYQEGLTDEFRNLKQNILEIADGINIFVAILERE